MPDRPGRRRRGHGVCRGRAIRLLSRHPACALCRRHGIARLRAAPRPRAEAASGTRRSSRSTSTSSRRRSTPSSWRRRTRWPRRSARRWSARGPARLRSVGRVPPARRGRSGSGGIRISPDAGVCRDLRPDRALPRAPRATRRCRVRRLLPDGGHPAAAAAASQAGLLEPGIIIDAKSGVSGRRQDADRAHALLRDATAASSAYGVFAHRHGGRDRAGARHCRSRSCRTCVPLDRGILETIYARVKPGVDDGAVASALEAAYKESPFVRLTGAISRRSSTSRTPISATSAGGSRPTAVSSSWWRASTTW